MGLRGAVTFLTRIPTGPTQASTPGRDLPWFGVVGILVGGLGGAVYWAGAHLQLGPWPAAVAAVTVTALLTGAFHEDGLADSVDGLVGGWTVEDRLRILKDSRHGTYGVLALVLVTLWKVATLAALAPRAGWLALVVAHSLARSVAVGMMAVFPAARADGLGSIHQRGLRPLPAVVGGSVGLVVAIVAYGLGAAAVIVPAVLGATVVGLWAWRRIGGITGDLLGAGEQVAEVVILAGAVWLAARG